MTIQIAVRLPEDLVENIDALVRNGAYRSRSEAMRRAVEGLVRASHRRAIDEAIVDGYRRVPATAPTELELDAAIASVEDEPW